MQNENSVLISAVVTVDNASPQFLREMIDSLLAQVYQNWELCIAFGSGANTAVREIIKETTDKDTRVKYISLNKDAGIAVLTNEVLKLANGDFILFMDSDITLYNGALLEIVKAAAEEPDVNFFCSYSQVSLLNHGGLQSFKPGRNFGLHLGGNYFVHLAAIRRNAVLTNGIPDSDFFCNISEVAERIKLIPKILHSRQLDNNQEPHTRTVLSYRRNHLKRLTSTVVEPSRQAVKLSLTTVFYGGLDMLSNFLDSVCFDSDQYKIEVIVVNLSVDNSDESIDALKPRLLKIIGVPEDFDSENISAAYNYAAGIASGDYFAFANYCAVFSGGDFFEWLIPFTLYTDCGLVTGAVEYRDRFNSVTLMGDNVGIDFPPEEIFIRTRRKPVNNGNEPIFKRGVFAKDVTAVTDVFALVKRTVFEEAGGFDESFPRVFYMMDLSLRLNEMGYSHVSCDEAKIICQPKKHPLYAEDTEIFEDELDLFYDRHYEALNSPERYANPNVLIVNDEILNPIITFCGGEAVGELAFNNTNEQLIALLEYDVKLFLKMKSEICRRNIERIRKQKKIKVAFMIHDSAMWCYESIYRKLAEDPQFDVCVAVFPFIFGTTQNVVEKYKDCLNYFVAHGYKTIAMCSSEIENAKNTVEVLSSAKEWDNRELFDVVFHTYPHHNFFSHNANIVHFPLSVLNIYIPYGAIVTANSIDQFDQLSHSLYWKIFSESAIIKQMARKYSSIHGDNMVVCGYLKMDSFYGETGTDVEDIWKFKDGADKGKVKKIIFAPHWSVGGVSTGYGTFEKNYKDILRYAKEHADETSWIFRPHPELLTGCMINGVFKTKADYDDYLAEWDNLPNAGVLSEGPYTGLFKTSDAMILDSGSFMSEYLFTGNPMLYLTRESQRHNEYGNMLKEVLYKSDGGDIGAIFSFINNTVINGLDPMKEIRNAFFEKHLNYIKHNGKLACDFVYDYLTEELC